MDSKRSWKNDDWDLPKRRWRKWMEYDDDYYDEEAYYRRSREEDYFREPRRRPSEREERFGEYPDRGAPHRYPKEYQKRDYDREDSSYRPREVYEGRNGPDSRRTRKEDDNTGFPITRNTTNLDDKKTKAQQYAEELRKQMAAKQEQKFIERGLDRGLPLPGIGGLQSDRRYPDNTSQNFHSSQNFERNQSSMSYYNRNQPQSEAPAFFGGSNQHDDADKKAKYRRELEEQVKIKNEKLQREQERLKAEDLKKEQEIISYNPFGKGGAGAPLRDRSGKVITRPKVCILGI